MALREAEHVFTDVSEVENPEQYSWYSDSDTWRNAVISLFDSYNRIDEIMRICMDWTLLPALLTVRLEIPPLDTAEAHPRYVGDFVPPGARRDDKVYVSKPGEPPVLAITSLYHGHARRLFIKQEGGSLNARGRILRRVLALSHIHLARRYTSDGFDPLSITNQTTPYLLGRCLNKKERINYAARDGFIKRTTALWEVRAAEKGIDHDTDPAEIRFRDLRNHYSHGAGRRTPHTIGTGKPPQLETGMDIHRAMLHPETLRLFTKIELEALEDLNTNLDAYADLAAYEVFRLYRDNGRDSTGDENPDRDLKERLIQASLNP